MIRLLALLFPCAHKRTTFPLTPSRRSGIKRQGAYVVCLDCGSEFDYDWSEMRIGTPATAPAPELLRREA